MTECKNLAADVAAGRISQEELDELFDDLSDAQAELGLEGGASARAEELAKKAETAAAIEARNRMLNILAERRLMAVAELAAKELGDPSLGLSAKLVGINSPFSGSARSVDKVGDGIYHSTMGAFFADLKRDNLFTVFNKMDEALAREVADAMHDMNLEKPRGVKVSEDARKLASLMQRYQEASRERVNRAGAYIQKRSGYVVRQTHDSEKLTRAGADAWKNSVRGKLDFVKMGILGDTEEFLDSAYDAIRSGIRLTSDAQEGDFGFKGPGNLAKKSSAARLLEFKTPKDWFDYDVEFGSGGDLGAAFIKGIERNARTAALMGEFGTNPEAMLEKVVGRLAKDYRRTDAKTKHLNMDKGFGSLRAQLDEVSGDVNMLGHHSRMRVARISRNIRAVQTMAKLGGAVISATSDLAFGAAARTYHGRGFLGSMGDSLTAAQQGLNPGARRDFMDRLGAGLEGQLGDVMSRFNPGDQLDGRMNKAMQTFFKFNLLRGWTDGNKRGMIALISRDLGDNASKVHENLSEDMQRLLKIYGIGATDWEIVRQAARKGPDDKTYLMPGEIDDIEGLGDNDKDRLREGLFALLTNEADIAVPSPGARERAILRGGYRPGTGAGEALRFLGQFKSFGVVALTKVMGRQVYGTGSKTLREQLAKGVGGNLGMVHTILMASVMGALVVQAKEMAKGREMRDWNDPNLLWAGMLQGGGMGIYGDFLFGEYQRFGGTPLETVAGPTFSTASDLIGAMQAFRGKSTGQDVDPRGDALQLVKGNIPFANLFYAKSALDYTLWWHIQEMISPGYLQRMERRMKRDNDQEFFLPPSDVIQRGGGFR